MKRISILVCILFFYTFAISQEIRISDFRVSPYDVSAIENQVLDINDEPCGLIKVRTGLEDITFSSNRSIEKVEMQDGEYWVWIPESTTHFNISAEAFPLLQYQFPEKIRSNVVYIINLTTILAEKKVYWDTVPSYASISTVPAGARVYLDSVFQGVTPLQVIPGDSIFELKLEKRKYLSIETVDTLRETDNYYYYKLEFDHKFKRFYFLPFIGFTIADNFPDMASTISPGINFGRIGKTGFYLSARITPKIFKPELELTNLSQTFVSSPVLVIPLTDIQGVYYSMNEAEEVQDRKSTFCISAGLTQQILNPLFLTVGAGYCQESVYREIYKQEYQNPDFGSNPPVFVDNLAYAYIPEYSYRGISIELGAIIRIRKMYLLYLSGNLPMKLVNGKAVYQKNSTEYKLKSPSINIGFGINL